MVEGIVNTEGTNAAGFYYDYGAVDEVAVNAGGNTAEMPWPGVWSNFVAKSGGNSYHGKIYADYQNERHPVAQHSRHADGDLSRAAAAATSSRPTSIGWRATTTSTPTSAAT